MWDCVPRVAPVQFSHECQVRDPKSGSRQPNAAAKLHAPLARLLRPLVRLCIRSGMTFPALAQLLRELFVNVAEHDFALEGKEQTDSRVSLLTGIHRKEVARLRGAGAPVQRGAGDAVAAPARSSRAGSPRPSSPMRKASRCRCRARPRAMRRRSSNWSASITKDVRPRAVLDEWLDRKLVTINGDDEIVLLDSASFRAATTIANGTISAATCMTISRRPTANVSGPAPRFLERAVHYDGLSPKLARRLEARSRELAMDALKTANREANRALAKDKGGDARWNFGVYIYQRRPATSAGRVDGRKAIRHDPAADHFASSAAGGILARRDVRGCRAQVGRGNDHGIGGTGITRGDDHGIGGTGIVGVIQRFGSIFVNGERIGYAPTCRCGSTAKRRRPRRCASARSHAWWRRVRPTARWPPRASIAVSEVIGPIETVKCGELTVLGQKVVVGRPASKLAASGTQVAVYGLRRTDGVIVASLVERRRNAIARVTRTARTRSPDGAADRRPAAERRRCRAGRPARPGRRTASRQGAMQVSHARGPMISRICPAPAACRSRPMCGASATNLQLGSGYVARDASRFEPAAGTRAWW